MELKSRFTNAFKIVCWMVLITFCGDGLAMESLRLKQAFAQEIPMPVPGTLMNLSPMFSLPTLKAISIDPQDPFKLNFVVDSADQKQLDENQIKDLTKYFLSFLTLPEEDLWVNLSPYEKNRIVMPDVEKTSVGKDMLVQDYILKQLAASMTYPENETGKVFWKKVRERAQQKYGVKELPMDTFTKVWVVPDQAVVYEQNGAAFIAQSRLKVLLEKDYLSLVHHKDLRKTEEKNSQEINGISSEIAREVIIPELEREVNQGKHFAPLRQMYHSLILAIWFKKALQKNLINQVYANQKKTDGIAISEKNIKEKIYDQYLEALKKGVYSIIHEDYDEIRQESIPHKYFSGGFFWGDSDRWFSSSPISTITIGTKDFLNNLGKKLSSFSVLLNPLGISKKALLSVAMAGGMMMVPTAPLINDAGVPDSSPSVTTSVKDTTTVQGAIQSIKSGATQSTVGTKTVSEHVVHLGERISGEDQQYLKFLHSHLTPSDLIHLNGQTNAQTGQPYYVDGNYFKNHWGSLLKGDHFDWSKQTLVIAYQEKHQLHPDGQLGPETRQALEKEISQNPTPAVGHPEVISKSQAVPDTAQSLQPVVYSPTISPKVQAEVVRIREELHELRERLTREAQAKSSPERREMKNVQAGTEKSEPYHFSIQTTMIPIEQSLVAQNNGIIQGLDSHKRDYQRGEAIFMIVNPDNERDKAQYQEQIKIAQKKMVDLEQLFQVQAATLQEVNRARAQLSALQVKNAAVDQRIATQTVRAPYAFSVKDWKMSNGMTIAKGGILLDYYGREHYRVVLELPTTISDFSQVQVKVDDKPVRVGNVRWNLSAQEDHAQVTLDIIASEKVNLGQKIHVQVQIAAGEENDPLIQNLNIKAQTLAQVHHVQERSIVMPTEGPLRFLVKEGDKVKQGQVIAVVLGSAYVAEYEQIMSAISSLEEQLGLMKPNASGISMIPREQVDALRSQLAAAYAQKIDLRKKITRLAIRAPEDGVIIKSEVTHAGAFEANAEILRMRTRHVVVGDLSDPRKMILLPKAVTINPKDPVVIQTPSGKPLVGQVISVNTTPYDPQQQLSDMQAIVIQVSDRQGQLSTGLPVKVIIPAASEKNKLRQYEQKRDGQQRTEFKEEVRLTRALWEPSVPARAYQMRTSGGNSSELVSLPVSTEVIKDANAQKLSIQDVEDRIAGNTRLIGGAAIEFIKTKTAEKLPDATRIALQGGVWMADGKLVVGGGVQGAFNNVFSAGLSTGNAIGAALPVVFQVAGNIIDALSGKKIIERDLAILMTQMAYHEMEAVIYQQASLATNKLIELGAIEEKLKIDNELLRDLQTAKLVLVRRQEGGFSVQDDLKRYQEKIDVLQAKMSNLESQRQALTVDLNSLIGHSTRDLHPGIMAQIDWDGVVDFTMDEERAMLVDLREVNPRIRQARAVLQATQLAAGYQEKEKLPSINFAGLFINDGHGLNPIYDFIPGTTMKTSRMAPGANGAVRMEVPLFDSGVKTRGEMKSLEILQAENNLQNKKAEVRTLAAKTTQRIRDLNIEMQGADIAYQHARSALQVKQSRPDLYTADQLVEERMRVAEARQALIELKAQQFQLLGKLRELGLRSEKLKPKTPTVQEPQSPAGETAPRFIKTVDRDVSDSAAAERPSFQSPAGLPTVPGTTPGGFMSVGYTTFPDNASVSNTWALMTGSATGLGTPVDALKRVLMEDANLLTRQEGLNHLLTEHPNNKKLNRILADVVLNTPYLDVVQEIFKYLVERKDHNLRFVMAVIDQAQKEGKSAVADLGYQAIGDILTHDQELWNTFSEELLTASSKEITLEMSRQVLLTFLAREPDDSIAKARLLMSDYWTTDDLAQIYHGLMKLTQAKGSWDTTKVRNLARLIKDTIAKRNVIANISDVYQAGALKTYPEILYLSSDIYARLRLTAMADTNRQLVFTTSSPWPNLRNDLPSALAERAEKATEEVLQGNAEAGAKLDIHLGAMDSAALTTAPVSYFESLAKDSQKAYIRDTSNIADLVRLLQTETSLRALILDRLMATSQGRIAILQVYTANTNPVLDEQIQSRDWIDVLKADIATIDNFAARDIVRRALIKFYDQTQEEWPLNLRLATYSYAELHTATDPRGKAAVAAQIDLVATRMALDYIQKKDDFKPVFWVGASLHTPQEMTLLRNVELVIKNANDPAEVRHYLQGIAKRQDKATKDLVNELIAARDMIAQDIVTNNQDIPKVPTLIKGLAIALGTLSLGFVAKSFRKRVVLRQGNVADLIENLRRQLVPNGNGDKKKKGLLQGLRASVDRKVEDMVISIPKNMNGGIGEPLVAWQDRVRAWDQSVTLEPEDLLQDMNEVLNHSYEILRHMPYAPDLMWQDIPGEAKNEGYQKALSYYNLLAIDTLHVLSLRLSSLTTLSDIQRERLSHDIEILVESIAYVTTYLRVLECRGIIDKVMSYKYADDHWAERSGIYPFIRLVLLYGYLLSRSHAQLKSDIPELISKGNQLMPDFYDNVKAMGKASLDRLTQAISGANSLSGQGSEVTRLKNKNRSFWTRVRTIVGFLLPVALGIISWSLGVAALGIGFSILGGIGFVITLALFWMPHVEIMSLTWNKTLTIVTTKLSTRIDEELGTSNSQASKDREKDLDERVINLSLKEGLVERNRELNPAEQPRVDMILIFAENSKPGIPDRRDKLDGYVKNGRGRIFRNDIPVEVYKQTDQDLPGSGNAYLRAVELARQKLNDPNYRRQYPLAKPWEQSRVMIVFQSANEASNSFDLLDLAILNGYRAAAYLPVRSVESESTEKDYQNSQHIVVYARDAILGPIQPPAGEDISFLTVRVDQPALTELGFVNTNYPVDGDARIHDIFEKLDIAQLKDAKRSGRLKVLQDHQYDLNNPHLNQYPAAAGLFMMGPEAVKFYTQMLDDGEYQALRQSLPQVHMMAELIIPFLLQRSKRAEYVQARMAWEDINRTWSGMLSVDEWEQQEEKIRKDFLRWYGLFGNAKPELKMGVLLSHSGAEKYIHVTNLEDKGEVSDILRNNPNFIAIKKPWIPPPVLEINASTASSVLSAAQQVQAPGGVDLSITGEKIEFKKDASMPVGNGSNLAPPSLNLNNFKGFEFQIYQFQPLNNPVEFLMGKKIRENHLTLAER